MPAPAPVQIQISAMYSWPASKTMPALPMPRLAIPTVAYEWSGAMLSEGFEANEFSELSEGVGADELMKKGVQA